MGGLTLAVLWLLVGWADLAVSQGMGVPAPSPLDVDCVVSGWGPFSACSQTCGPTGGVMSRERFVLIAASGAGTPCPTLREDIPCNVGVPCGATPTIPATDCVMSGWGAWTACSGACGGAGTSYRTRNVLVTGTGPCPATTESMTCTTDACGAGVTVTMAAQGCVVSGWGGWSACTAVCTSPGTTATGTTTRKRVVLSAPQGSSCPPLEETISCNIACASVPSPPSAVDCVVSGWSAWSACNATCGGYRARSRTVLVSNSLGGTPCPTNLGEVEPCSSAGCGATVTPCVGTDCTPTLLPPDCVMSGWSPWSACDVTCISTRTRTVISAPPGVSCPPTSEDTPCCAPQMPAPPTATLVPPDCVVTAWSPWSACDTGTTSCGPGTQTRTRTILQNPNPFPCTIATDEQRPCTVPCVPAPPTATVVPPQCTFTGWSAWTACNVTCGTGWQFRSRAVLSQPVGVLSCDPLREEQSCDTGITCPATATLVPATCQVTGWSAWSPDPCPPCGGGDQTRTRSVFSNPASSPCPALIETRPCGTPACGPTATVAVANPCPGYTGWSAWGSCNATCGGGYQKRQRTVYCPSTGCPGAASCTDPLEEYRLCNNVSCVPTRVDCVVGNWSGPLPGGWSSCSIDCCLTPGCGGGVQSRTRPVLVPASGGGTPCPVTSEQRACNNILCTPVDCQVSAWTAWSACDVTCGPGGTQKRTRTIITDPKYGGTPCPGLVEMRACSPAPPMCSTPCSFGPWSGDPTPGAGWSPCSESCGGGWTFRTQKYYSDATGPSPPPCTFCTGADMTVVQRNGTLWMGLAGQHPNHFSIAGGMWQPIPWHIQIVDNGTFCIHNVSCNTQPCVDRNCTVSKWTGWSECSRPCKHARLTNAGWVFEPPGKKHRTRYVTSPPLGAGTACPPLEEEEECNDHPCDIDCIPSIWGPWSQCSGSCWDPGPTPRPNRTRTRTIVVQRQFNGRVCGPLEESSFCDTGPCTQSCVVGDWGAWSSCSKVCGGGTQTRTREVILKPIANGVEQDLATNCPTLREERKCNEVACRVGDCEVSDWEPWGRCLSTSGDGKEVACANKEHPSGGEMVRVRHVTSIPSPSGLPCPTLNETRPCNTAACPEDCIPGDWSEWSACSAQCGGGVSTRKRVGGKPAANGGHACPAAEETRPCNTHMCSPDDCQVSDWSSWSACPVPCGGGVQERERVITKAQIGGGAPCPALREWRVCNSHTCPVDCEVGDWGEWTQCSAACGGGKQESQRHVVRYPEGGGVPCPPLTRTRDCNTAPCKVGDCTVSGWTAWSQCTAPCNGGTQRRKRTVTSAPIPPATCPPLEEVRMCNLHACSKDCLLGDWTGWDMCSHQCAGGQQQRVRPVLQNATGSGRPCPVAVEVKACNTAPCRDADCKLSSFSDWSPCSLSCGGGTQYRTRTILADPTAGGAPCPASLREVRPCNVQTCPEDCKVTPWTSWSLCSKTCGGGVQLRKRWVERLPSGGGAECPVLEEHRECNTQPCGAGECLVTDWSDWTACTATCGENGVQVRKRSVVSPGTSGCPPLEESFACNRGACNADCVVSEWQPWELCSATCGGGVQSRHRWVVQPRAGDGAVCPSLVEQRVCAEQPCTPGECVPSAWSDWSTCTQCGATQSRSRSVPANCSLPDAEQRACPPCRGTAPTITPRPGGSPTTAAAKLLPIGTVSLCAKITLDGTLSTARVADPIIWTTSAPHQGLVNALHAASGKLKVELDLTAVLGVDGVGTYDVCLRVGGDVHCEGMTVVSEPYELSVEMEGGSRRVVESHEPLSLHVHTKYRKCQVDTTTPPPTSALVFEWSGLPSVVRSAVEATQTLKYPSLYIPGGVFDSGVYLITAKVCPVETVHHTPAVEATCRRAYVEVVVQIPPLAPREALGNRTVLTGGQLLLDGGTSRDPAVGAVGEILYSWHCSGASCPAGFPTPKTPNPVLTINTPPEGVYLFTLEMVRGPRFATSNPIEVKVVQPTSSLPLRIACNCDPDAVDSARKLVLWADLGGAAEARSVKYTWTMNGVTGSNRYFAVGTEGGKEYEVKLRVVDEEAVIFGDAYFRFRTKQPPTGGSCSVTPRQGTVLQTLFTVACEGWTCPNGNPPFFRFDFDAGAGAVPLGAGYHNLPSLQNVMLDQGAGETVQIRAKVRCLDTPETVVASASLRVALSPSTTRDYSTLREMTYTAARQGQLPAALRFIRQASGPGLETVFDAENITQTFLSIRQEVNTGADAEDMVSTVAALARRMPALGDTTITEMLGRTTTYLTAALSAKEPLAPSVMREAMGVLDAALPALGVAAQVAAGDGQPTVLATARNLVEALQGLAFLSTVPGEVPQVLEGSHVAIAAGQVETSQSKNWRMEAGGSSVSLPFMANEGTDGYSVHIATWRFYPYRERARPEIVTWYTSVEVAVLGGTARISEFPTRPLRIAVPVRDGVGTLSQAGFVPVYFDVGSGSWRSDGLSPIEARVDSATGRQVVVLDAVHTTDFAAMTIQVADTPTPADGSSSGGNALLWVLIVVAVVLGACLLGAFLFWRRRRAKRKREVQGQDLYPMEERRVSGNTLLEPPPPTDTNPITSVFPQQREASHTPHSVVPPRDPTIITVDDDGQE